MHVYVVYAHPSRASFTWQVLQAFTRGLEDAGHTHELGDLYAMGFRSDMDEAQYLRETGPDADAPVPDDVRGEQGKIGRADALAFLYPVWWSGCPAVLKGWFDRVWTLGYAYYYEDGAHRASRINVRKALVLCPAGHPVAHLEEIGIAESMRRVMLDDRLLGVGVEEAHMEILGGMAVEGPDRELARQRNLARAYELGQTF